MSDIAQEFAGKLESSLFVENEEQISKEYGKKFRDLLTGLKNDENYKLRSGILLGEI